MNGYMYLAVAIIAEVVATSALKASDGFTNLAYSLVVAVGYGIAFYCLSIVLKTIPVGIAYAIWSGLGIVLILAAVVLAVRNPDPEKVSAYECGFNAFDDARMKFDVRFYLVSILFIIFDLEIAFLFPWAVGFKDISDVGFWSMMVFLGVLTIGFAYEWKKGALEWE